MVKIKLIVCLTRKILPHILDTSNIIWSKTHIIILFYFELLTRFGETVNFLRCDLRVSKHLVNIDRSLG
jgi:hypothetical protein